MAKNDTTTKLRSAPSSADTNDDDQLLIQQWLAKKGNKVTVFEYNTRTNEEDINYLWKKNKTEKS
jgi:hypothetical protein